MKFSISMLALPMIALGALLKLIAKVNTLLAL